MSEQNMKPIHLHENFHKALQAIKDERGASKRFTVHIAIREHIEKYYPSLLHVIRGDDETQGNELKK